MPSASIIPFGMRALRLLLLLLAAPSFAQSPQAKTVLIFVPEDSTVPSIASFTRSFRQTVERERQEPVTVNIEYLDMAWFESPEYARALRDFYVAKHRARRPEAIVVFADATPFVVKLQQELWPQVPLLAVLNDDFLAKELPQSPFIRANWADLDVPGATQVALRLLPDTRHVALVLGSSQRELDARLFVEQEIRSAAPDRELISLSGLTLEELQQQVRTLPEDSVVMMVGFMQDAKQRSLVSRDVLRLLHAQGSPPLFSVHKTMLGEGIVGGVLLDYELIGQQVARRTLRVLKGEPVSNLPQGALDTNLLAFDDRELKRWSIPDSRLPPGSVVRFREPGLWERYRWQVSAILVASLLKAALIIVLLLERRRRMGAQVLNLAVLDSLPGAVAILDRHGVVRRTTQASSQLEGLGEPLAAPLLSSGGSYLETFREAARSGHSEAAMVATRLEDVLSGRSHEALAEFRGFEADTWFELRARRLRLPEGGAVVSLVDVTPRRRAEQEARKARDERAHLERVAAVGELGVSIAHELNQPLAAILTNAEMAQRLLQRSPTNLSLLHEMLEDIVSDNKRAGEVIHHMRTLLKKGETPYARHDFNELVRQVSRLVSNDAQLRGVHLTLRLAEAPLPVWGDDVQLQQVMLNLIVNAMDATGSCLPGERNVWVYTRKEGDRVELVVEDTGPGLNDEVLARIFEPFFTTKPKGLGMGLSISRSILEVHQGRLHGERRPERGALFRCTLPLA
ncbi:sensor histidine kinase [Hyalangium rubrum]|uniref:histidine kinase n=1 Tax=Hyalangium rubrum TaxID=3103134 RepID=A0ABU5HLD0_9BACT|nr:ATP-binding protein [Hyalangium sp. s54d21]MDY7232900.1 ATP-binding protein [Hyalangium sp. s54d21]